MERGETGPRGRASSIKLWTRREEERERKTLRIYQEKGLQGKSCKLNFLSVSQQIVCVMNRTIFFYPGEALGFLSSENLVGMCRLSLPTLLCKNAIANILPWPASGGVAAAVEAFFAARRRRRRRCFPLFSLLLLSFCGLCRFSFCGSWRLLLLGTRSSRPERVR